MFQLSYPCSRYGYKKGSSFFVSRLVLSPIRVYLGLSASFRWLNDKSSALNLFSTETTAIR